MMWFRSRLNFWRQRGINPTEETTMSFEKRNMYDDAVEIDGRDVISFNMAAKLPWGTQIEKRWTRDGKSPGGTWMLAGEARDGEQLWVRPKA